MGRAGPRSARRQFRVRSRSERVHGVGRRGPVASQSRCLPHPRPRGLWGAVPSPTPAAAGPESGTGPPTARTPFRPETRTPGPGPPVGEPRRSPPRRADPAPPRRPRPRTPSAPASRAALHTWRSPQPRALIGRELAAWGAGPGRAGAGKEGGGGPARGEGGADPDVHSWAPGEVEAPGPAAGGRATDAGTGTAAAAATMSDQQLDCALDLMRRLPPQQIEKNLSDLIDLVPSLCEDLLSSVDQPLKIARDKVVGKDYLLCDYNRDGDSYRSPWSNKYDPPLEDGAMPSARLRKLEVEANNAFDQYRDLYFEGGVSSVYLWDLDHGFAGVILIKKAGDGSKKIKGCWDSIHVVEVQEKSSGRTAHYKLTSTVMLWLQTNKSGSGTMNLGGSLTRQPSPRTSISITTEPVRKAEMSDAPPDLAYQDLYFHKILQMEKDETVGDCSPHIANIGRLVEDMENKIRSTLNEIYFGKTKDIVNGLRSVQTFADKSKQEALKNDLVEALKRKQQC
uniref:CapZ beta n=1 Tax=Papio anubis TaxID=9555 RepID=A0A8I5N070_PAPAN